MRTVALVPMRHSSERVPGKNYRVLGDRPLFAHIVDTLLDCHEVDHVVIDTDSDTIRRLTVERYGARVEVIERPEHLRAGETSMNDVLLNTTGRAPADWYLQTHSTNPLLQASTIDRALRTVSGSTEHDSLFGVTRLQTRLYDEDGQPLNHDPAVLLRTQDLPPVFEENSNLYVFSRDSLVRHGNRIGARPMLFEVPAEEAWDIDEELDFRVAECLWAERAEQR